MGAALLLALFPALLLGFAASGGDDHASEPDPDLGNEDPVQQDDGRILGTTDSDTLVGTKGDDFIDAGHGNDEVYGGAGNDVLRGNLGADYLEDTSGADSLYGGYGNDDLIALDLSVPGAPDLLDGGANDDALLGDNGDTMVGGDGADQFSVYWQPGNAPVTITDFGAAPEGSAEPLTIWVDQWDSNSDFHLETAGSDVNVMVNGETVATLANTQMTDTADLISLQIRNDDQTIIYPQNPVARIFGTTGSDTLVGTADNNFIDAGHGNDLVSGGAGDDVLRGNLGADYLEDTSGADSLYGGYGNDALIALDLGATSAPDLLDGGANDDFLMGDTGDTMTGGTGTDGFAVYWQPGNEPVTITDFGNADDGTSEALAIVVDQWDASSEFSLAATDTGVNVLLDGETVAHLVGAKIEDVSGLVALTDSNQSVLVSPDAPGQRIIGTNDADILDGTYGNDTIAGWLGPDDIAGFAGNDQISGGYGNDTLYGGAGEDTLLGGANNDVLLDWSGYNSLDGGTGNDQIFAFGGHDTLYGGEGDDVLGAGTGNNQLFGDAGNDTLMGYTADTMTGGTGADTFVVERDATLLPTATVTDFSLTEDRIELYDIASSESDLLSFAATADGTGTAVTFDGATLLILQGVQASQMNLSMVQFA